MKNQTLSILAFTAFTLAFTSCKDEKKAATTEAKTVVEVAASETYIANTAETFITWEAKKIIGGHQGTIKASSGVLEVKGKDVVGGNFIIDINSLDVTDIEEEDKKANLIGHLKNEDFFDVAKHANGAFEITSVTTKESKSIVAGNLTLKGIKKNIEFPATIVVNGGTAMIKSEPFNIDRTEWNINFHSGKLTDSAALGDKLIKDEVSIVVSVTATK